MTLHAGGPYVDSGALAKLYIVEPGSAQVQESVEGWRRLSVNSLQEALTLQTRPGKGFVKLLFFP